MRTLAGIASQFTGDRAPELIEHSIGELVSQRIISRALGYEDLDDHDRLRP
jgi:hypothetical protein